MLRLWRLVFILTITVVFILAVLPAQEVHIGFSYDKLNHIAAFFVLGVLTRFAWPGKGAALALLLLLGFGILIEVVQYYEGRDASFLDVMADIIGLALAVVVTATLRYVSLYRQRSSDTAGFA